LPTHSPRRTVRPEDEPVTRRKGKQPKEITNSIGTKPVLMRSGIVGAEVDLPWR
jgi:hypothetical protein